MTGWVGSENERGGPSRARGRPQCRVGSGVNPRPEPVCRYSNVAYLNSAWSFARIGMLIPSAIAQEMIWWCSGM